MGPLGRPHELLEGQATTGRLGSPIWRVASYGVGETFPAHYDQADSMTLAGEEQGTREVCTSSHTLLIYLSPPETFAGGATRLFLSGKYDQDTVDIKLPQGYALVFQQKGMLHAGLGWAVEGTRPSVGSSLCVQGWSGARSGLRWASCSARAYRQEDERDEK